MMIAIIIFLLITVGILGYLAYVNYRRAEKASEYCEAYVQFITTLYFSFTGTRDKMKEIDRLGAFEADDEVGVIFKDIDQSINNLYEFITKYVNREESKEDEKTKD
jgi:hypothetical protein